MHFTDLPAYIAPCLCLMPTKVKKDIRYPGTEVVKGCVLLRR